MRKPSAQPNRPQGPGWFRVFAGRVNWIRVFCLAMVPAGVGIEPDSSATRIKVAGGGGSYVTVLRDCEGRPYSVHDHRVDDVGAEISHEFAGGEQLGVRAGYVKDRLETVDGVMPDPYYPTEITLQYVNPYFSIEGRRAGFGLGLLRANRQPFEFDEYDTEETKYYPSWHLRLGNASTVYFSTSFLEHLPLYSGGGGVDAGIGMVPDPRFNMWMGLSGGIYDRPAALVKMNVSPHPTWAVHSTINYAGSQEYGLSLGLSYSWIHR